MRAVKLQSLVRERVNHAGKTQRNPELPVARVSSQKCWVQNDTGWDLIIISAVRAWAKYPPAHWDEEPEWCPCSQLKHNWVLGTPCPALPFVPGASVLRLPVLSVRAAPGGDGWAVLWHQADPCTSLTFQTFSDCEMKPLLLLKSSQCKHISPKQGQLSILPALHTWMSKTKKREKEAKLSIFTDFNTFILNWGIIAICKQNYLQRYSVLPSLAQIVDNKGNAIVTVWVSQQKKLHKQHMKLYFLLHFLCSFPRRYPYREIWSSEKLGV